MTTERKGTAPDGRLAYRVNKPPNPGVYMPRLYVAQVPGDGGVDWGWTNDPNARYDPAIKLNVYWQRRFEADMSRLSSYVSSWGFEPSLAAVSELTEQEQRQIDSAWEEYLNTRGQSAREAQAAWDKYQQRLTELGVIATLAGYRKSCALSGEQD